MFAPHSGDMLNHRLENLACRSGLMRQTKAHGHNLGQKHDKGEVDV